jgi:hypothetical protein
MTDKKHDEKAKEAEDRKVQADVDVELEKADREKGTKPDQSLPEHGKPDNALPGDQPKPDHELPGGRPARPDNALPGDQPGIDNTLPTPPVAQVCPTCGQRLPVADDKRTIAEQLGGKP